MPASTRIGHVHLNVADLERAEAFYCELLGFDVTVRGFPGALFVATGGYHHDLGLNTWSGRGGPPPPAGGARPEPLRARRRGFDSSCGRIEQRLERAGVGSTSAAGAILVADPFGNGVLLRTR